MLFPELQIEDLSGLGSPKGCHLGETLGPQTKLGPATAEPLEEGELSSDEPSQELPGAEISEERYLRCLDITAGRF